ncbi:methyl-accepting chemotaxis protein [Azospirillum sp.]|uniref:methyl-accepting chemotaxis protein n=1 Tax=Azospirillum sp. TaxID=34012 RepID=UPI003D742003
MARGHGFGVGSKVYALVGTLCAIAVAIALTAWHALGLYQEKVYRIQTAAQAAQVGERVNATILAIVMDSRGVYIADSRATMESFAKPLLANLGTLDRLLAEWKALAGTEADARFAAAERNVRQFIAMRTELVELGRRDGAAAARAFGDNDANRATRQALNREVETLTALTAERIAAVVDDLAAFHAQARWVFGGMAGAAVLGVLLVAVPLVRRGITGPLNGITAAMTRLSAGDRDTVIPGVEKTDEIGALARAAEIFKRNAEEMVRLQADAAAAREGAERERRDAMAQLADRFESAVRTVVESVASSATQLRGNAVRLAGTTDETSQRASSAASASSQSSSSVDTIAAATDEIASAIAGIAAQVGRSGQIVAVAAERAQQTDTTVASLSDAAARIGEVVGLIQDIAEQTNLLALNATIEAARAGEAGKGFAVVAGEVKALASQTARATGEIAQQIAAMQTATTSAVEAIRTIVGTIGEVNAISAAIADSVDQQGAATAEVARNVQEAALGLRQVTSDVGELTHAAETTRSAADEVRSAAGDLTKQAEALKYEVDAFLMGVRAA